MNDIIPAQISRARQLLNQESNAQSIYWQQQLLKSFPNLNVRKNKPMYLFQSDNFLMGRSHER